jgi:hypothetical protein
VRLIPFENPDKEFHEHWEEGRSIMNFPHPFRAVLIGPPNSGKGSATKNLMLQASPEFERFIVVYVDPGGTTEFDEIMEGADKDDAKILGHIPTVREWGDGSRKTMVIVDDLDYNGLNSEQKVNLSRLFGNASTHKNISVCLTAQDPFNIPPAVRRCANLWVMWKMDDDIATRTMARRIGHHPDQLKHLMSHLKGFHDSLWIDRTFNTPYPYRLNGVELISPHRE